MQWLTALSAAVVLAVGVHGCTTIVVGKAATIDGSVMATHTDDAGTNSDARLGLLAAADHPANSRRPVYYDIESYPHEPREGQKPIGYIPEVPHTYRHFANTYGIMNEHQVGMAESTCSAVFGAKAVGNGGDALLSIDALSRIGLERCASSRCAVQTMGRLAEEFGFYGPGSFEGSAESLMVIDATEAFVFHILPDDTGKSAIWAAARVPDDGAAVVANMFVIREVNLTDSHNFLGSSNMHRIASDVLHAWSNSTGELLDFTRVFSDGEYAHKYYSGRRMWGAMRLLAPSANLPDQYDDLKFKAAYPFAVIPDKKIAREDLFQIHRSYYEGTPYDMTVGVAAGPWGNPDRWNSGSGAIKGAWERSIGLFRTSHTHLVQARSWLPDAQGGLLWYGPHSAPGTCFVPFSAGVTSVPTVYAVMNPNVLDKTSAYWAHRYVFNLMHLKYSYMRGDVNATAFRLESKSAALVESIDKLVRANPSTANLTALYAENAEEVVKTWWTLPDMLIGKYADGYLNDASYISYTDAWLNLTNFVDGPPAVPCPPCPCTPSYSPTCSACCGKAAALEEEVDSTLSASDEEALRICVQTCNVATSQPYATCVARCL